MSFVESSLRLSPNKPGVGLEHLGELSKIRRDGLQRYPDNVKQVSECRICGTCSFACTTKFLGTFMRQHLYTHVDKSHIAHGNAQCAQIYLHGHKIYV